MLTVSQPFEEAVGLLPAHPSVGHRRVEPGAGVPETDVAHGLFALLGPGGGAQTRRLVVGDSARFDHMVEPLQEAPVGVRVGLVAEVIAVISHGRQFIET